MAFLLTRFFFFLLLLAFSVVFAQNNGIIKVGDSITAGDHDNAWWLSPLEDFAFGFQKLEKDQFSPAIWYHKIKEDNIIWYAINEDKPVLSLRQSKLELTANKGLVLTDPQGKELWKSTLAPNTNTVAHAVMNDTGNFMVVSESTQTIWESFKHPRDTLLPTQIMEIGGQLSSRLKEKDFSSGRFQFRMLSDGNAVLNTINLPSKQAYDDYYFSGTRDGANSLNSGYRVIFDPSGYLYLLRRNGEKFNITSPNTVAAFPASNYYHRATLNFDGVLTLSYYPKSSFTNSSWNILTAIPDNICIQVHGNLGTGPCGYNSICTLANDQRPSCKCPTGYSLLDPSDEHNGCKPNLSGLCDTSSDGNGNSQELGDHVELLPLPKTDWLASDYELLKPSNLEDCKQSCLRDCLCAVVVYDSAKESCWKKKLPLSNGREGKELSSTAFIKFSNLTKPRDAHPLNANKNEQNNTILIVVSALLGSSVFVNFILMGALGLGFLLNYKKYLIRNISYQSGSDVKSNLRHFTYKELEEATNGFQEELGSLWYSLQRRN